MNCKSALNYVNSVFFIDLWVKKSGCFEKFIDKFELTLGTLAKCNWHLIVVLWDFNMKSSTLYINDKTTTEDAKIELATSKYELH